VHTNRQDTTERPTHAGGYAGMGNYQNLIGIKSWSKITEKRKKDKTH